MKPKVTIVGAGLGGALIATYLGRMGYEVDVFEKRTDPRGSGAGLGTAAGVGEGRSINLALSHRGIYALEQAGIAQEALKYAIPMRGRMIHSPKGELAFQAYSDNPNEAIHSISRAGLNIALLNAAKAEKNVRYHFQSQCTSVQLDPRTIDIRDDQGARSIPYEVLVGSDGAFSVVCRQLQRLDRFDYSQSYLSHGYKELTIPAGPGGTFRLEKNALHIWPRGNFMMIALPNLDGSFTCTLFWPFEGENSFAALTDEAAILSFFKRIFPDAVAHMPTLAQDFLRNPTSSLVTVRCSPWHYKDQLVLVGDACHAVVPFYGQGMNASFEDCAVLRECLETSAPHLENAFKNYEARRKPNTDALAELAVDNFVEMRDKVASPFFRLKKKLDHALHHVLPRAYIPLYNMVTFTRIPYADAQKRARIQDRVLAAIGLLAAAGIVAAILLR